MYLLWLVVEIGGLCVGLPPLAPSMTESVLHSTCRKTEQWWRCPAAVNVQLGENQCLLGIPRAICRAPSSVQVLAMCWRLPGGRIPAALSPTKGNLQQGASTGTIVCWETAYCSKYPAGKVPLPKLLLEILVRLETAHAASLRYLMSEESWQHVANARSSSLSQSELPELPAETIQLPSQLLRLMKCWQHVASQRVSLCCTTRAQSS